MGALLMAGASVPAMADEGGAACDHACLKGFMTGYLDAMVARDPAKARLAADVRFTENGQVLSVGDGLWGTIGGLGTYRHDFVDPQTGQVASFVTIREGRGKAVLTARLKVENGKVSEIETIVARSELGAASDAPDRLDAMGRAEPVWAASVPEAERMDRKALRDTANAYFTGLERNDGRGFYPFADDCERVENGFRTTNQTERIALPGLDPNAKDPPFAYEYMQLGCKAQFELGYYQFVDRIRDRRFPLIDTETGTVFTFVFFDHSGTIPEVTLTDGRTIKTNVDRPYSWGMGEAFKIENGKIRRIEALMTSVPYGMPPNWPAE
ncbi:hypothetical protein [Erythrobacter sp. SG61-1L]|uniref:hypothetical protein n=1 Tax=Erythrobacter sp. SG61-1L TaxID=1603897 RepID=UPI000AC82BE5|nr:hypothetical protein [Erythrobacter sp. SG61-1L]